MFTAALLEQSEQTRGLLAHTSRRTRPHCFCEVTKPPLLPAPVSTQCIELRRRSYTGVNDGLVRLMAILRRRLSSSRDVIDLGDSPPVLSPPTRSRIHRTCAGVGLMDLDLLRFAKTFVDSRIGAKP